ncbi:MAG: hypothetical protein MUF49_30760 [Oculatellaceae cyanobacterium Prado106]|jgi:hypothetical protein|nr:hypothetical protein [Oculatellaceae cyanobacterium Prado106]
MNAYVANQPLEGVDILHVNSRNQIDKFRVEVRPLAGAQALSEAILMALKQRGIPIPDE